METTDGNEEVTRGRAIGNAGGITHQAMKERIYSTRDGWTKDIGENCARMALVTARRHPMLRLARDILISTLVVAILFAAI